MWEEEGKRNKGDTWWRNEEIKETFSRKKDAHAMCQNSKEKNKRRYKSMKNKAKKSVSQSMPQMAEEAPTE